MKFRHLHPFKYLAYFSESNGRFLYRPFNLEFPQDTVDRGCTDHSSIKWLQPHYYHRALRKTPPDEKPT